MINLHDCFLLAFSAAPFVVGVCDQIVRNSINFETAKGHEDILADSLRDLGYTVTQSGSTLSFYGNGISGSYANGKFNTSSRGEQMDVDAVKQSFGKQVVRHAARKFGWKVKEVSPNKFVVTKRV